MKSLKLLFVVILLINVVVNGDDDDEYEEIDENDENIQKLIKYTQNCMKEEKASLDDVKTIGAWTMPETREGQCMAACIAEKIGMIRDGKFSPAGTMEGAQMVIKPNSPDRDEAMAHIENMAEECKSVEHEDRCQLVVEIFDCLHE